MRIDNQIQSQPDIIEKDATQRSPKESKGERLYNAMVYGGISYLLNLGTSLVVADYFLYLGGKKYLEKGIDSFARGISSLKLFSHTTSKTISTGILKALALTSGGMALLIPTKIMEDRKRPIVHWINKHVFKDKQLADDGHEKTPDEIYVEKEQPKQSWWNVIKRRLYAAAVILSSGGILECTIGSQKTTNVIVDHANKVFKSGFVPGGHWLATNPHAQRYLNFAALDTIFTGMNAVTMYLTNGAKKAPNESKALASKTHIIADQSALTGGISSFLEENLAGYKKQPAQRMETYADKVNASEPQYSMAP